MKSNIDFEEVIDCDGFVSISEREHKGSPAVFLFDSSISSVSDNGYSEKINIEDIDKAAIFSQNLKYWNKETAMLSVNNLDNSYFQQIVDMGVDAVPFIVKELKKGPTPLVNALDRIFPGVVKFEGFISLEKACEIWISILRQIGYN